MTLRDIHKNSMFHMLMLYLVSLGALVAAYQLVRCAAGAISPNAARAAAPSTSLGEIAAWVCANSLALCAVVGAASLVALVVTIMRARTREANMVGMAVLAVLNCLFSVGLMGIVLMSATGV